MIASDTDRTCLAAARSHSAGSSPATWFWVVGLTISAWTMGCGSSRSLDNLEISRLIQNSTEFKQPRTVHIKAFLPGNCESALSASDNWLQLRQLGLIEVRPGSRWDQGRERAVCEVVLTEETRREINTMSSQPATPTGSDSIKIPVGERNFVRVMNVGGGDPESAEVNFAWQWQPNLLGRKLGVSTRIRAGNATLWQYEDGWRLVKLQTGD